MDPIRLEVIAFVLEGWGLCQSCEALVASAGLAKAPSERGLEEAPEDMLLEYRRLSALLFSLSERYGDRLLIRLYDPFSLQGLAQSRWISNI